MAQMTFERHEKKYLLDAGQAAALRRKLAPYMNEDQYGLHTICSVYFDTKRFDIARRSELKPIYKEKLRLRSYGVPDQADMVYLELKKKLDGVTYKRRMALPLSEANAYLWYGVAPEEGGQVFGEIDWFVRKNRPVPKAVICYDRIALYGKEDKTLRVTFDANIRWRDHDLDLADGDEGMLLAPGGYMMEIKTNAAIPLWLADILSRAGAYPTSFSKYGNVYGNMVEQELFGSEAVRTPRYSRCAQKEEVKYAV